MKTIRFFAWVFTLAVLSLGFTGCEEKKEDPNVEISDANLIGKWYAVSESGYEKYADHPELNSTWTDTYKRGNWYWVFNADHTFEEYEVDEDDGAAYTSEGVWSLAGNKLTVNLVFVGEGPGMISVMVKSLTKSVLTVEESEKHTNEDGPYEFGAILTLSK